MTTKEKEKRANETPIVKSLFDLKGNTKHKEQLEEAKTPKFARDSFVNPFAQKVSQNETAVFGGKPVIQKDNPFSSSAPANGKNGAINPFALKKSLFDVTPQDWQFAGKPLQ